MPADLKIMAAESTAFIAKLPEITAEQRERLQRWAKATCSRHALLESEDGSEVLICVRKGQTKNVRDLLRANMRNWGIQIDKQSDWLTAVDPGSFETYVATHAGRPREEPGEEACRDVPDDPAATWPVRLDMAGARFLESLSPDFDQRSAAMLAELEKHCTLEPVACTA